MQFSEISPEPCHFPAVSSCYVSFIQFDRFQIYFSRRSELDLHSSAFISFHQTVASKSAFRRQSNWKSLLGAPIMQHSKQCWKHINMNKLFFFFFFVFYITFLLILAVSH